MSETSRSNRTGKKSSGNSGSGNFHGPAAPSAGGYRYAILSGGCASAASVFGKLSGLQEDQPLLRLTFFLLMLVSNAGVWTLYVKALHGASSSLTATVTSAATNYLLSAASGFALFNEVTSLLWWAGAGLILMGLVLVITEQIEEGGDDALIRARQETEGKGAVELKED